MLQPDGRMVFKKRGPPPVCPPGYEVSGDPYILVPKRCVHLEEQSRVHGCCPQTFTFCRFYKRDIAKNECISCPSRQ